MSLTTSVLVFVRRPHLSTKSLVSRDRLVVRTLRCGRSNPGSNPGHGMQKQLFAIVPPLTHSKQNGAKIASAGNRTRINCLEGSYADHYTTDACLAEYRSYMYTVQIFKEQNQPTATR